MRQEASGGDQRRSQKAPNAEVQAPSVRSPVIEVLNNTKETVPGKEPRMVARMKGLQRTRRKRCLVHRVERHVDQAHDQHGLEAVYV